MGNEKSNKLELNELVQNERHDVDIVEKLMGSMGRWQVCICFALMLCKIPIAWHQLSVLIIAPPIASFCIDNVTDTCSPNCSDIVFDRSLFTETIQSQWNLVCNKSQLPHVSQTLVLLGVLIGNLVFGMIADKFGRRKPLIAAVVIQSVGSIAAAFVPWFWIFSVCRFIAALGTGGMIVTSFVLLIEIIGSKWRTHIAILFQIPFDLGQASLGLIGYFFRDWQQIQLVISIPPILLLSYYWILPESPRWLLLNKQAEDAIHVLRTAARFNKVQQHTIESDVRVYIRKRKNVIVQKGRFYDILRSRIMRTRTICLWCNCIACGFCLYGNSQYVGHLGGNMFVNIALSAIMQIPGTLSSVWFIQHFGLRYTLIVGNFATGCLFFLVALIPPHYNWVKVVFAVMVMYTMSVCFSTLYFSSGQLFPTIVRNVGVSTCLMTGRMGMMIAPFVVGLGLIKIWFPPAIFSTAAFIGAVSAYHLPKTRSVSLPETVEEVEGLTNELIERRA